MLNGLVTLGWRGPDVALHTIERIDPVRTTTAGKSYRTVHLRGGEQRDVEPHEIGILERRIVQLLPAAPGTKLLHVDVRNPDDAGISDSLIIGWALCLDGDVRPLTPAGIEDGCGEPDWGWFVEMPDGRVQAAHSWGNYCGFDSRADLLEQFVADRRIILAEAASEPEGAA